MADQKSRNDDMLRAIRRVIQAVDVHSRALIRQFDVTTPQLLLMSVLQNHGEQTAAQLSKHLHLSQATMTGIVQRLQEKGLITRRRSEEDKRKHLLGLTEKAKRVLEAAPSPLQQSFLRKYEQLPDWEQMQILSVFERVAGMMAAQDLDASPVLTTGAIADHPDAK